jgi:hypothetical protein
MARYADLKRERDEAIERAVEAERLSLRTEVDRIRAECAAEIEAAQNERDLAYAMLNEMSAAATALSANMTKEIHSFVDQLGLEQQVEG